MMLILIHVTFQFKVEILNKGAEFSVKNIRIGYYKAVLNTLLPECSSYDLSLELIRQDTPSIIKQGICQMKVTLVASEDVKSECFICDMMITILYGLSLFLWLANVAFFIITL